jgi:hypothetical protein
MAKKMTKKEKSVDIELEAEVKATEVEAEAEVTEARPKSKITFVKAAVVIMVVGVSALVAGVVWINKSDNLVIIPTADVEDVIAAVEVLEQEAPVVDTVEVAVEQETAAAVAETQPQAAYSPYAYAPAPYVMPGAQAFNDMIKKHRETVQNDMKKQEENMMAVFKDQEKRRQKMEDRISEFKATVAKRRAESDERFIKAMQDSREAYGKMHKGI